MGVGSGVARAFAILGEGGVGILHYSTHVFHCEIKIVVLIRFLYCHFFVFLTFHVLRFTLKHLTSWFFPFTAEQSSQRQRENLVT